VYYRHRDRDEVHKEGSSPFLRRVLLPSIARDRKAGGAEAEGAVKLLEVVL
jgi:hypothetical protein